MALHGVDFGAKGIQLYDHKKDPRELKNLADDPRYATVIREMKALAKQNWPVRVEGGRACANPAKPVATP